MRDVGNAVPEHSPAARSGTCLGVSSPDFDRSLVGKNGKPTALQKAKRAAGRTERKTIL